MRFDSGQIAPARAFAPARRASAARRSACCPSVGRAGWSHRPGGQPICCGALRANYSARSQALHHHRQLVENRRPQARALPRLQLILPGPENLQMANSGGARAGAGYRPIQARRPGVSQAMAQRARWQSAVQQPPPPVTPEGVRRDSDALRPLPAQRLLGGMRHGPWASAKRGVGAGQAPDLLEGHTPWPGALLVRVVIGSLPCDLQPRNGDLGAMATKTTLLSCAGVRRRWARALHQPAGGPGHPALRGQVLGTASCRSMPASSATGQQLLGAAAARPGSLRSILRRAV